MRVLVVGGTGGMGQGVARELIRHRQVRGVILGGTNTDPGRIQKRLRADERVSIRAVDVDNHTGLVSAIKEVDVVINCAGPFYRTGTTVAWAAVEAGVDYIDICDDHETTSLFFSSGDMDKAAREAGITILTGMGSDPGTNNILVKWYAHRLDRVDEARLYWVISAAEFTGATWDHCLHMVTGKTPRYTDGRLEYVDGGSGEETIQFIDPLGTCVVRHVGHPQPVTIPRYIKGVKTVVIKGAVIPGWVDRLIVEQRDTGFLGREPVRAGGARVIPYDMTLELWKNIPENRDKGPRLSGLKVVVKGERGGGQVTYTADIVGRMAPGTGLPASIAALMLNSGEVKEKGVVAPEGCIDPEKFLKAFLQRGARIHQTETIGSILTL